MYERHFHLKVGAKYTLKNASFQKIKIFLLQLKLLFIIYLHFISSNNSERLPPKDSDSRPLIEPLDRPNFLGSAAVPWPKLVKTNLLTRCVHPF